MVTEVGHERQSRATRRDGERCRRFAMHGTSVCFRHGGAAPQVKAAAERRQAEAEANKLLGSIWRTEAEPVRDPITALQQLAGQLQHAVNALGTRLDVAELDGPTALAWSRVTREFRQALEGLERLNLDGRQLELEQAQAATVVAAVGAALDEVADVLTGAHRDRFLNRFLVGIGREPLWSTDDDPPTVVRGELG